MKVQNKSCIWRLSLRALWSERRRNVIAVIAILLTSLLFTSLFTVLWSLNATYQEYTFHQIGGYSHGTFKEVTEEQAAAIAAHPKVDATGLRQTVGYMGGGVFRKLPAELSYMDANCAAWSYATPTTGHAPRSGNELATDLGALQLLGIEPELGAQITLTFEIIGEGEPQPPRTETFTLSGWWESDPLAPVHYINLSKDYVLALEAEYAGAVRFRRDLNVMLTSTLDLRGQMMRVDTDLGYTWDDAGGENNVRIGVNWGYSTEQAFQLMDGTLLLAVGALLVLIAFTGYLIIYNIFQISVSADIRFYGLLKTIGVTPRQLRRIIRQQALVLCLPSIPAGLLLGYGLGAALLPAIMRHMVDGTLGLGQVVSTSPLVPLFSVGFALVTVLLSCARPGRIAGRVSPVEAMKYTEAQSPRRKQRNSRRAGVFQMALANLGRNRLKTGLVVVSLALALVLLDGLAMFTAGFDSEKYLSQMMCADFILSSTDYFRYQRGVQEYLPQGVVEGVDANTTRSLAGSGYKLQSVYLPQAWVSEALWTNMALRHSTEEQAAQALAQQDHRDGLVRAELQIEGLDEALMEKVNVFEGDLAPLWDENAHAIAMMVDTDDYGNPYSLDRLPAVGDTLPVQYIEEAWYIDTRTGERPAGGDMPIEFLQLHVERCREVVYTVCALVEVPNAMEFRYRTSMTMPAILLADRLREDSGQELTPMFYLFDTPDAAAEAEAEQYLARLTAGEGTNLVYESKATMRAEFNGFRNLFLLLGGLLCGIIGVIGTLNFFNAIMTGILARKREFAVLQAVGMTSRQLRRMLVYEGLFYAAGSAFVALALSLVMNPLLGHLMETMFWFFSGRFTVLPVLVALPVFALLGWAVPTALYSGTARQSIVERLRQTE